MIDPHTGGRVRRAEEPPPVSGLDVATFTSLLRGIAITVYGDAHEDVSGSLFRRRRSERPALDAAMLAVSLGEPGALGRLEKLDPPIAFATGRGKLHYKDVRILTDLDTVEDDSGVSHPVGSVRKINGEEGAALLEGLRYHNPRNIPKLGRPPRFPPESDRERSRERIRVRDELNRMATPPRRGFGKRAPVSKAVVLRRISARITDPEGRLRRSQELRAQALDEALCFWATRTTFEREFYLSVYVYGELDHDGRTPSETVSRLEWERTVNVPTEAALLTIGNSVRSREVLFRGILETDASWSFLKSIYRTWIEVRWPGTVKDNAGAGWEQDPSVSEWDGTLRPFIVHSSRLPGD